MVTRYNIQDTSRKVSEYRNRAIECYAKCTESRHTDFWERMAHNWESMADSLETVLSQQAYCDTVELTRKAA